LLIAALKERGTAIANCDWDTMRAKEQEITELIMEGESDVNEKNYRKLTTPVTAFITFNSDDGLNEALLYAKSIKLFENDPDFVHKKIMGVDPAFAQATEPTNIIWENRHIKGINYGARVTGALVSAFILLVLSFSVIVLFKSEQINMGNKYPSLDCDQSFGEFRATLGAHDLPQLQVFAGYEYVDNIKTDGKAMMNGALKCFCEFEKADLQKRGPIAFKNEYGKDYKINDFNNEVQDVPLCATYVEDIATIFFFN